MIGNERRWESHCERGDSLQGPPAPLAQGRSAPRFGALWVYASGNLGCRTSPSRLTRLRLSAPRSAPRFGQGHGGVRRTMVVMARAGTSKSALSPSSTRLSVTVGHGRRAEDSVPGRREVVG
jgi:hypothetical protein